MAEYIVHTFLLISTQFSLMSTSKFPFQNACSICSLASPAFGFGLCCSSHSTIFYFLQRYCVYSSFQLHGCKPESFTYFLVFSGVR